MTGTGRPVDACAGDIQENDFVPLEDFHANFDAFPPADPAGGEDGATTPGGPRMVLILLGVFGALFWLRRRRRKK